MRISEFFLEPDWVSEFETVSAGFTLPILGNQALTRKSIFSKRSTGDNRRTLAAELGDVSVRIFSPHQVHGDQVIEVTEHNAGTGGYSIESAFQADAVISKVVNILLITTWADCIPVLLYEPVTGWVASIHSGWKSTRLNIVSKVINILRQKGAEISSMWATVGPGIRDCCYEVSADFRTYFPGYQHFFRENAGSLYFNLQEVVYSQLLEARINISNIDYYARCTCCSSDPWFFSCRKDNENFEGQAAFIMLKGKEHK